MELLDRIHHHFRRGEYLLTRRLAEAFLGLDETTAEERATVALIGAEAAYRLNEVHASINLSRLALQLAEAAGDPEGTGRAWFRLGAGLIVAGDTSAAIDATQRFLDGLSSEWPDLEAELGAKALSNLAMAYRNARRYPEALQSYWQSLVRFQRANHIEGEINCRLQTAWLLILLRDLEAAEEHLGAATALLSPDVPGNLAIHRLTCAALLRLHQERYQEALELANEVLMPEREGVSHESRAVALYVAGMSACSLGQLSTARTFHGLATDAAVKSGLSHLMNLVQGLARALILAAKTE